TYQQLGTERQLQVDKVLVSAGREPMTAGLNAAAVGIELDQSGFIQVDALCQTRVRGIYAIGDVVRGPMLAHKASEEGMAVAERIAGQQSHVNYDVIPWVIYTHPEIAWVGRTTTELDALGIPYKTGQFPFKANGRAHAAGDLQGMVKLISDAHTDRLLGAHILGPNASEMIAEAVVAMEFSASAEDIARTIHAHPTLSESFHEAALAVDRRTIHI
ncbi:MAG: dihydrolipoamide dehydrogenase, partial [Halothiobacillaceae bacterium]